MADWLPIALDTGHPRWFFIVDNDGPRRFAIGDWDLVPGRSLRFSVAIPEAGTTHAEVCATVAGPGAGSALRDALAAAYEADPLACRRLDVHASLGDAERLRQARLDRAAMGRELGSLHDDGAVDVDDLMPLLR